MAKRDWDWRAMLTDEEREDVRAHDLAMERLEAAKLEAAKTRVAFTRASQRATQRAKHSFVTKPAVPLPEEAWADIPDVDGNYQVSNRGRIRNARTGRMLAPHPSTQGYLQVSLSQPKPAKPKTVKVHRLVARLFIPNPDDLPEVNHMDCNKLNNAVTNLEWVDRLTNYWHAHHAGIWQAGTNPNRATKYSCETIAEVRKRRADGVAFKDIAAEFGMSDSYVRKVVYGRMRANG